MHDRILIQQLEISTYIGVPDTERKSPQRLTVDLILEPFHELGGLADEIGNTVDYAVVALEVQRMAAARPRRLIETLAEDIASMLLDRFSLQAVELVLRKYILPDAACVAVQIRRERR